MDNVHPLYRIIAVLCVSSVAKALFAPARPVNTTVSNVTRQVAETAADKLTDVSVKGKS